MTDNDQLAQQNSDLLAKQLMAERNANLTKCALDIIEECNQKIIDFNDILKFHALEETSRENLCAICRGYTDRISDYSILKQKLLEAIK